MNGLPILSLIILTPAVGAVLLAFVDRKNETVLKQGALMVSCVALLLSLTMLSAFDGGVGTLQLEENVAWVPSLGISYHLGIDGISVLLVLLTTFTMPLVLLSTWKAVSDRVKEYQIALLLLQSGMLGAFLALDLVLFYLFWEAMLIPMYFIIGIWGGQRRIYAAIKFFIYTMVGSLLMFVAILYLWKHTGTFDLPTMLERLRTDEYSLAREVQVWLFAAFALSFAIKVPIFPLHTWLPDAHVEAPTAGSVVLAAVLLKMGTYGFIRFGIPLFPEAATIFTPAICWLAVIGIIFGACMALVQNDIKKLIAYSSVSHLGFVVLGIFMFRMSNGDMATEGVTGAILQMVNHGLSTGMLFLMIGIMYERRHTRELANYGGLAKVVPIYSTFFIIATLSSIGLPGLNGFVGEFLILLGTFKVNKLFCVLAATGVVLGAVYMLTLCKRFLFGPLVHEENASIKDMTPREMVYLTPIVVLMVWIGLYPSSFTGLVEPTVIQYLELLKQDAMLKFSQAEFEAILPAAILFTTGLLLLLIDACLGGRDADDDRDPKTHLVLTGVAGALLAFAALGAAAGDTSVRLFAGAMTDDAFGRFAAGIIIAATLLTTLGAGGYLASIGKKHGEFHGLIFLGAGAMVLLAQATNLISMFIAVETLSLAVYVLAGYVRSWRESAEGAFKYFVMGAFSSGFLLLGMAFLYGASGGEIQLSALAGANTDPMLGSVGLLLVVIGFAFKVGAVPFHSWVPDVYQGAPAPAAGWMAVAVKVASFAALLRIVLATGDHEILARMLAAVAVVTMVLGNLAALNQTNLKRMLAYSGIAHSGYLMIPVVLALPENGGRDASAGALFYLAGYLVTTIGAFTVLGYLRQGDRDCDTIDSIKGLARRKPLIALAMTLSMISLAGIPLTVGFMGKLIIFRDAIQYGYLYLAVIGVITSIVSVYYYLRPVVAMYFHEPTEETEQVESAWGFHLTLTLTSVGILLLGIFPGRLVDLSILSVQSIGS